MNIYKDIERVKNIKYLELRGKIDGQFVRAEIPEEDKQAIDNVLSDRETWKKMAEKLAERLSNMRIQQGYIYNSSKEELIDWAEREVNK